MNQVVFKNTLLGALDSEITDRLQLRSLELPVGQEIENPGQPIDNLIFIEAGIGSMTTTFEDNFQVEVGLFGHEAVMGGSALIGTKLSLNKVYMQMGGHGFSCPTELAGAEFSRFGRFHDIVLRYQQALLIQVCQSVGCIAHHVIAQRLSRWLLLCADRSESSILQLTHEYLGICWARIVPRLARRPRDCKVNNLSSIPEAKLRSLTARALRRGRACATEW
jgi:hypothetical protein